MESSLAYLSWPTLDLEPVTTIPVKIPIQISLPAPSQTYSFYLSYVQIKFWQKIRPYLPEVA